MMIVSIDQMGRKLNIPVQPQRIISLVPSQTELLYDLGVNDRVIGITKFCVHPTEWFSSKTRIGGTKNLDLNKIRTLNPDLIIGNKEENNQEQIEILMKEFPVWMSDINSLDSALSMIRMVSEIVEKENEGQIIIEKISSEFSKLKLSIPDSSKSVAYFIWKDPWMAVGSETFINDMLVRLGLTNVFENTKRYPETSFDQLKTLEPCLIFLSSEPFPFKRQHINELQTILPNSRCFLVDGELFSWYGSRLTKAPEYFKMILKQVDSPS